MERSTPSYPTAIECQLYSRILKIEWWTCLKIDYWTSWTRLFYFGWERICIWQAVYCPVVLWKPSKVVSHGPWAEWLWMVLSTWAEIWRTISDRKRAKSPNLFSYCHCFHLYWGPQVTLFSQAVTFICPFHILGFFDPSNCIPGLLALASLLLLRNHQKDRMEFGNKWELVHRCSFFKGSVLLKYFSWWNQAYPE